MSHLPKNLFEVLSKFGLVSTNSEVSIADGFEVFSYRGKFTNANSATHLRELEKQLDSNKFSRSTKKRVYSHAVEMIQNIVHHGLICTGQEESSFSVVCLSEKIHLISQNCIFVSDSHKISQSIESLNAMSDAELRKYHIDLLCDNDFSIKGGAGLGLVTLARKSDSKIAYLIDEVNSTTAFLSLHIQINLVRNTIE
jgi:hypothetical protein